MKKQPRKKPKPILQTPRREPEQDSLSQQQAKVTLADTKITPAKVTFGTAWKNFWVYAGPLLTLVGLWAYWTPSISLVPGVNLDPSQEFQSQFLVTNTGHVAVNNLTFTCSLMGKKMGVAELNMSAGDTLAPVAILKPGNFASRGCFTKSLVVGGPILKIVAHYRWPLVGNSDSATAYFSVREGSSGVFLVPEGAPSPEPPTLLSVGAP
jgi:hypothetical protein